MSEIEDLEDAVERASGIEQLEPQDLRIRWRAVAFGSAVVAIASLAALIIVTAVEDTSLLATVALSLAIVSFAIQIVVFLVQTSASATQLHQGEMVYSETQSLLREVRATAEATQNLLTGQFDTVLRAALRDIPEEVSEAGGTTDVLRTEELADQLRASVKEAIQQQLEPPVLRVSDPSPRAGRI